MSTSDDEPNEINELSELSAADLLAHHVVLLLQWCAVHLAESAPDLVGSALVIDCLAAMIDRGGERLGDNLALYRSAVAEIQQVYVRAASASED